MTEKLKYITPFTSLSTLNKLILFFNILAALSLLASYLAPIVSPQKNWVFAFLGLGYPILFLINLIFCSYWAIRKNLLFLLSALCLVAGFNIFFNNINFNIKTAKPNGSFRIMAYNVHNFNGLEKPINLPKYTQTLAIIKANAPEILTIEEFHLQSAQYKIIDSLRSVLNTSHFYFEPFIKTPFDSTGLAIFSKFPIINRGIVDLSGKHYQNKGIFADIKTPKKIIRIYCLHLESLNFDSNEYKNLDQYKLPAYAMIKNISVKLKKGFINRSVQANTLKRELAICKYPYIIAGDFNDTPASYAVNSISAGLKNSFREQGIGLGVTFNSKIPLLQIDYILASPEFTIKDHQVIDKKISDHKPVYSDVYLP
ncbi:endonuclease/exonuclease/phosphatase family protein [Mucilaginibacter myungsuensis]|uniref:Endonuclease/exonuclease/phosphatase family protein n=1 Tax=Mucilaginibacter myungsuensis TaxID=649104 RepID=A0A929KZA0_9SPHI|nr:endonuclease/exonuclease/phosphatase family protein [Mucilaginibacter myungsuensis]MBE9660406.1 endonuclease/exonuclease/phosphatase family protein [Mucilaginibacter myungsuensis]MDN3600449.1 endonuclease/exonuclease/phosphatase family protein [Mucilaginibacter myungsuensis]